MASSKEPVGQHKSHSILAFLAVLLSVVGILYWVPLLTLSKIFPDDISVLLSVSVYAYLYLLIPLNFHLNTLLLLVHVMTDTSAAKTPFSIFLKYLPWAANTVSLATILLSTPLSMIAAFNEECTDLAIGAALISVALVTILCTCIKRIFVSRGGFVPVYISLFMSAGFFTSHFSDHSHYDPVANHTPIRLILLFLSFFIFLLCIILLFQRIGTPTDKKQAAIEAEKRIIIVLSLAISTLLVAGYLEVYIPVANMEVIVKAGEP